MSLIKVTFPTKSTVRQLEDSGFILFLQLSGPGRNLLSELGTVSSVFGPIQNLIQIKKKELLT